MTENILQIHEIVKYLPHRYPFLLIDRVLEMELGKSLIGLKNVTANEPFFTGHFPHRMIMPGVLILEALAQAGGILAYKTTNTLPDEHSLYFFAGIDDARFKLAVVPGDQLKLHVEVDTVRRNFWKLNAKATVADKLACSAQLLFAKQEFDR